MGSNEWGRNDFDYIAEKVIDHLRQKLFSEDVESKNKVEQP